MNYQMTPPELPGKLQAISVIQTVVGGLELIFGIIWFFFIVILGIATVGLVLIAIPIPIIVLVVAVLSLVSGIKGLQKRPSYKLMMGVAICQMVLILGCDVISFGGGLTAVILLTQPESKAYFGRY